MIANNTTYGNIWYSYCMKHHNGEDHKGFFRSTFVWWFLALFKTAVIIAIIYFGLLYHHDVSYTGTGTVNLFPEGAKSKNYRVDGNIHVHSSWYGLIGQKTTQYSLESVKWPDGGRSFFYTCSLDGGSGTCSTSDNKYSIELVSAPTQ